MHAGCMVNIRHALPDPRMRNEFLKLQEGVSVGYGVAIAFLQPAS